eukprot:scaffold313748_cov27-Prasinocladus_malaysianus.AAC.1
MPVLNSAIKALDTIKPADIKLVESFKSPPATVKLVMEAVCVMLGEKPVAKADPDNPGKRIMDYWETSRKVLKVKTERVSGRLNCLTKCRAHGHVQMDALTGRKIDING